MDDLSDMRSANLAYIICMNTITYRDACPVVPQADGLTAITLS
jgi:hypothetical protein